MSYREDPDLEFFKDCQSSDLQPLVRILTTTKKGKRRITEELSGHPLLKKDLDYQKYWPLVARELQHYGANTFATMVRGGRGVLYREILCDVCDRMKVNYNKKSAIRIIEMNLLLKILEKSLEQMDESQLREAIDALHLKTTKPTKEAILAAMQAAIAAGGFEAYTLAVVVANAVLKVVIGRGLTFAGNAILTRAISFFAGPIGWVVTGLLLLIDIAGPAYRVTIPACVIVAYLRAKSGISGEAEQGAQ